MSLETFVFNFKVFFLPILYENLGHHHYCFRSEVLSAEVAGENVYEVYILQVSF